MLEGELGRKHEKASALSRNEGGRERRLRERKKKYKATDTYVVGILSCLHEVRGSGRGVVFPRRTYGFLRTINNRWGLLCKGSVAHE